MLSLDVILKQNLEIHINWLLQFNIRLSIETLYFNIIYHQYYNNRFSGVFLHLPIPAKKKHTYRNILKKIKI